MPRQASNYDWKAIVQTLRSERYLDCSQEAFSKKIGASVFSVSNWEVGKSSPDFRLKEKIKKLAEKIEYSQSMWPTLNQKISIVKGVKKSNI